MRTWASLPAGLRHATSAWPARYNSCNRRCNSSVACKPFGSSARYSAFHTTSPLRAVRSRQRQGHRINDAKVVRPFSNTRCTRIKVQEDEEEEEEELPQPATSNSATRRRPPTRPMPAKAELGQLIKMRKNEPSPPPPPSPPPKPFNPAQLREIDQKARVVFSLDIPRLQSNFLQLKWAGLEDHVLQCAAINRSFQNDYDGVVSALVAQIEDRVRQSRKIFKGLEIQFCRIAFRRTAYLQRRLSLATRNTTRLRVIGSTALVTLSQHAVQELRHQLQEEFLHPRRNARDRVDKLLGFSKDLQQRYDLLKEKHRIVKVNMLDIQYACRALGPSFRPFYETLMVHEAIYSEAAHKHRHAWLSRQKRLDPLREAELWDMTRSPGTLPAPDFDPISVMLFDSETHPDRRKLDKRPLLNASRIRTLYMPKWRPGVPAQSPELDPFWRQLDIMAPFFLQLKYYDVLLNEARYLLGSLSGQFGPMWSNIEPARIEEHKRSLFEFIGRMRGDRFDFISELHALKAINWVRLGVEKMLYENNLPNEIEERGFFVVPNPMSQDLSRFEDWTLKMAFAIQSSWIPLKAWEWAQGSNTGVWQKWSQNLDNIEMQRVLDKRANAMDLGSELTQRKGRLRPSVPPGSTGHRPRQHFPPGTKPSHHRERRSENPQDFHMKDHLRHRSSRIVSKPVSIPAEDYQQPLTIDTRPSRNRDKRSEASQGPRGEPPTPRRAEPKPALKPADSHQQPKKPTEKRPTKTSSTPSVFFNPRLSFLYEPSKRKYSTVSKTLSREAKNCSQIEVQLDQLSDINLAPTEALGSFSSPREDPISSDIAPPRFWSHDSQRGPNGQKPTVHYCRSLESTEQVSQLFLNSKVIGFDMEWKAQASAYDTIQNNLSMIQLANEDRIALFHIALFKPARTLSDFVAPSLKHILESEDVTKVGVSIKADATRLRKYLSIDTRSVLELSHLFKLVKYGQKEPKLVNKRMVNLSEQMEEHFGLPLEKSEDVRCSDWARPLKYQQVQYAATDPYACICLFNTMEQKRVAMDPMPPRPAHAELNLPILLPRKDPAVEGKGSFGSRPSDVHVNGHP